MEQHRVPAILYLATGFVANGEASTAASREQLTWFQLEEAVTTGLVTVGSQSHLTSPREAEEEMQSSKDMIEAGSA